jgi:hypothetical protein
VGTLRRYLCWRRLSLRPAAPANAPSDYTASLCRASLLQARRWLVTVARCRPRCALVRGGQGSFAASAVPALGRGAGRRSSPRRSGLATRASPCGVSGWRARRWPRSGTSPAGSRCGPRTVGPRDEWSHRLAAALGAYADRHAGTRRRRCAGSPCRKPRELHQQPHRRRAPRDPLGRVHPGRPGARQLASTWSAGPAPGTAVSATAGAGRRLGRPWTGGSGGIRPAAARPAAASPAAATADFGWGRGMARTVEAPGLRDALYAAARCGDGADAGRGGAGRRRRRGGGAADRGPVRGHRDGVPGDRHGRPGRRRRAPGPAVHLGPVRAGVRPADRRGLGAGRAAARHRGDGPARRLAVPARQLVRGPTRRSSATPTSPPRPGRQPAAGSPPTPPGSATAPPPSSGT